MPNIEQLKRLIAVTDENSSREDIILALNYALTLIIKLDEERKKAIEELGAFVKNLELQKGDKGEDGQDGKDGKDGIDGKDGRDGVDGKDGVNGINGKDGLNGIDGKDGVDGVDGKDGTDGKDADITFIDELKEEVYTKIEELKKLIGQPMRRGFLGGYTDGHVTFALNRITHTETPTGAINGANTAYTVKNKVNTVFSFFINGEYIHPSEYTISGATITFTTALPADLSGTGFTITYV